MWVSPHHHDHHVWPSLGGMSQAGCLDLGARSQGCDGGCDLWVEGEMLAMAQQLCCGSSLAAGWVLLLLLPWGAGALVEPGNAEAGPLKQAAYRAGQGVPGQPVPALPRVRHLALLLP